MNDKYLGQTELPNPGIIFGGNVFGWTLDEKSSFNILDAAIDYGFNFIDTANSYSHWVLGNSGGESEAIIGKWLKRKGGRDKVIIGTKVGSSMGKGRPDLSAEAITKAVNQSLQRLQTDYIDLYQSHHDDPETPVEETMETYAGLIKAGKVRYIGASNFSIERFQASQDFAKKGQIPSYQSLQPQYNLYDREDFEKNIAPAIDPNDTAVICYYALASGFLTGKYKVEKDLEQSQRGSGVSQYLNERGERILKALEQVADDYQTRPASIALAWLIHQPKIAAPIASATQPNHIKAMSEATHIHLEKQALDLLEHASEWK